MEKTKTQKEWTRYLVLGLAAVLLLGLGGLGCTVEKTEEGEMPDVDVDVDADAGELPEYDVDGPDVDVGTKEKTIEVPKVDVTMEEETITVPYVDVDWPGEDETDDQQVTIALNVPNDSYDVTIEEIHVVDDELWVVSRLEGEAGGGGEAVRISDTVVVRAPAMDVKHFVIGPEADGIEVEGDHEMIRSRGEIAEKLGGARRLYSS